MKKVGKIDLKLDIKSVEESSNSHDTCEKNEKR